MWDDYLSNENFDKIKDFENFNLSIHRVNDCIEIKFKHTYSVNTWIYEKDNDYYICFNHQALLDAGFPENDLKRERDFFKVLRLYKDHYVFDWLKVDRIYHYKKGNGNFLRLIKKWSTKYRTIISDIDPKDIRIEMSAGLDTRILSYFWRYNKKKYTVYTKANKPETELAIKTIQYVNDNFPCECEIITSKKGLPCKQELNGGSIIHGYFVPTTRKDFKDVIGNSKACNKAKHIVRDICPFYDKDILKLRGDWAGQVKLILFYLLCYDKDLYKQPVMSFSKSSYVFDENLTEFTRVNYIFSKDLNIDQTFFKNT